MNACISPKFICWCLNPQRDAIRKWNLWEIIRYIQKVEPFCMRLVPSIHLQCGRLGFDPWVGKIPWRRAWRPTPVFLPGESPWTEEPVTLPSIGSQRVGHDWATKHSTHTIQYPQKGSPESSLSPSATWEYKNSSLQCRKGSCDSYKNMSNDGDKTQHDLANKEAALWAIISLGRGWLDWGRS